jgi:hypothetical protein
MYQVIAQGSTGWSTYPVIWKALREIPRPFVLMYGGGATGADAMIARWGKATEGVTLEEFKADWGENNENRSAGYQRNRAMLDAGADLVIVFRARPEVESRGTDMLATNATRDGVEVRTYFADGSTVGDFIEPGTDSADMPSGPEPESCGVGSASSAAHESANIKTTAKARKPRAKKATA